MRDILHSFNINDTGKLCVVASADRLARDVVDGSVDSSRRWLVEVAGALNRVTNQFS